MCYCEIICGLVKIILDSKINFVPRNVQSGSMSRITKKCFGFKYPAMFFPEIKYIFESRALEPAFFPQASDVVVSLLINQLCWGGKVYDA